MGLFGNDKAQDERMDAIEEWLQGLTGVVQQHKLDTTELRLNIVKLQAEVNAITDALGDKLEATDFDPAILQISEGIAEARVLAKQAADAAEEGWKAMQEKALAALDELEAELEAAERDD